MSGRDREGPRGARGLARTPRCRLTIPLACPRQLGGCGILGVGIWLAATQGNFATLSSSFPSLSAANLLIVTGTFIMAIGFVGCIGAIKENKCLLLTVSAGGACAGRAWAQWAALRQGPPESGHVPTVTCVTGLFPRTALRDPSPCPPTFALGPSVEMLPGWPRPWGWTWAGCP